MAVKNINNVTVYDAEAAKNGTLIQRYQFSIPTITELKRMGIGSSTADPQGYAISGGYYYVYKSNNVANNVSGDLKSNNVTWNGKLPYCEILVKNNKVEKHYLDNNSDFCIILLLDANKSVVIDKRFENSIFTKLVLEKSNSTALKPVYQNKKVVVWKSM
jgi:hypothetical protein